MPEPSRASDVIETQTSQAAIAGVVGVVMIVGGVVFSRLNLAAASIVMFVIAAGCIGFALYQLIKIKSVPMEVVDCPYCQHHNKLTARPTADFRCMGCQRQVPVVNGIILPVYKINCEHCQAQNFFSKRSIKLICEECGKDVNLDSVRQLLN